MSERTVKMNTTKNVPHIDRGGNIVRKTTTEQNREKNPFDYTKYINLGFQLAAPLLFGVFLGLKLDEWFKTKPIFTVSLIIFGAVASLYSLIKITKDNA